MMTAKPQDAERFLIVRLSAIGDTIHSLPLAAALRRLYPDSHIGWLVEKPSAALVVGNPLLDWTHVLPKGWLKSPRMVWKLRSLLREQKFAIAFDVQGLTKSAVAAWLSGAPKRIGFTRGEAREIAPLLDNKLLEPVGKHVIDMTLSLLAGLDAKIPAPAEFILPAACEADRGAIAALAASVRYENGFILLGPWGSFSAKLWPLERFCDLAKRLHKQTGLPSLMLGHGEKERGTVQALAAAAPAALALAPDLSVTGVAELAAAARLFVGCDSFPMHAATAVGCPTLGLFGVTDPERLGPYGSEGRSIFATLTILRSTRDRKKLTPENLLALSVDKVEAVCLKMLQR